MRTEFPDLRDLMLARWADNKVRSHDESKPFRFRNSYLRIIFYIEIADLRICRNDWSDFYLILGRFHSN